MTDTSTYGKAEATAWDRLHPRLTHRAAWLDHEGKLPVIKGSLIRLHVEHLPGDRHAQPMWLWWSGIDATESDVDRLWQAYLRRFDLEHTFRLFKRTLLLPKVLQRSTFSLDLLSCVKRHFQYGACQRGLGRTTRVYGPPDDGLTKCRWPADSPNTRSKMPDSPCLLVCLLRVVKDHPSTVVLV